MPTGSPPGSARPARVSGGARGRRDVQVAEDRLPHGADAVGDWGSNPVSTDSQAGSARERAERARQEEQRHYQHLGQRHERLYLRYPGRHHYAERGERAG
jgi:hypothetical protein